MMAVKRSSIMIYIFDSDLVWRMLLIIIEGLKFDRAEMHDLDRAERHDF